MPNLPVMKCPECGSGARILSTRAREDGVKRRRHECLKGHRFTTVSTVANLAISPMKNKERTVAEMKIFERKRSAKRHKKLGVASVRAASIFDAAMYLKESSNE